MKNLLINADKDTFSVVCNCATGLIEFRGISYPQDAAEFFNPIFVWLDQYVDQVLTPELTRQYNIDRLVGAYQRIESLLRES